MEQYNITGMSCAACVARVEKAVNKVEGVKSCSVSLLTNSMGVEGTAKSEDIIKAVKDVGYGASLKGSKTESYNKYDDILEDRETPILKKRLILSLILLIPLMYFSMGHMMLGFKLPHFFDNNHIAMGLVEMLLTIAIMIINKKFFVNGFKSLLKFSPNMDTLVALGSGASFIYSLYALFAMTYYQTNNNLDKVVSLMDEFYFESAAMILTLITVGKMLEAYSKGKTTNALKSLIKLSPKTATIIKDNKEITLEISQVKKDDIFIVKPGEKIPVDGIVIEGVSAVDESALTGESIPVDKEKDDEVSAGTINSSGFLKCRATRVGEDTALSQIIKMVSDAAQTKAPIAKIADKVSGVFVPVVIIIALITAVVWLVMGENVGFSLARGISVLVISCPCALGLATPVAIMVGNGVGAKNGIMFKTSEALEQTGKIQIVALDKTGTITKGEPEVTDIIPINIAENELLEIAATLEKNSEHPLSKAIIKKANEKNIKINEISDFKAVVGNGLTGNILGEICYGGNYKFISDKAKISDEILNKSNELANFGKTPLYFTKGNKLIGIIAVADVVKEESEKAIKELKNMGIRVVMVTGDNEKTAKAIGREAGVDEVFAEVLPNGKEEVIRNLSKFGRVMMVGDGINDSPALTRSDIGVAIGAGTDIAIDSADVVLAKSRLTDVGAAIRLSRKTIKNIYENLFWAFIYNIIGIPLASGLLIPIFGLKLNPMFGAAAMSLSSFCVVTNALRINLLDIYSTKKDKKIKQNKKEILKMTKTIEIKGMM
ncbi:MAG: heavy metal translocating P-type ATPase, partial [Lachnospirales bacterium]